MKEKTDNERDREREKTENERDREREEELTIKILSKTGKPNWFIIITFILRC